MPKPEIWTPRASSRISAAQARDHELHFGPSGTNTSTSALKARVTERAPQLRPAQPPKESSRTRSSRTSCALRPPPRKGRQVTRIRSSPSRHPRRPGCGARSAPRWLASTCLWHRTANCTESAGHHPRVLLRQLPALQCNCRDRARHGEIIEQAGKACPSSASATAFRVTFEAHLTARRAHPQRPPKFVPRPGSAHREQRHHVDQVLLPKVTSSPSPSRTAKVTSRPAKNERLGEVTWSSAI